MRFKALSVILLGLMLSSSLGCSGGSDATGSVTPKPVRTKAGGGVKPPTPPIQPDK